MTQIGSVYGQALYDLAKAEGIAEPILQQITVLAQSFAQEPDFLRLLSAPNLSKQERCDIVDQSFRGKTHEYVVNFLKILVEKGYAKQFCACCDAYRQLYNQDMGILTVRAVTAVPLTEDQSRRLGEKLGAMTGKTIDLQNTVDPHCLGGVRLDYDGKRLDDTVSRRLEAVGAMLKSTLL